MPAGGSYEVAEMPNDYVSRPVEMQVLEQHVVEQQHPAQQQHVIQQRQLIQRQDIVPHSPVR